ncbi:hypothetical protein KIPB_002459 [Kipferlia bialata]|uniref:Uncharacterized protein n=1 Tax=Kipferlia bialata TaxID=797122 RepID=A0A9K3GEZ3_9EUKA|nr:hypothetical protein KIPB_002459 [Kipferlia bialata]|eukprot:g2459.t1
MSTDPFAHVIGELKDALKSGSGLVEPLHDASTVIEAFQGVLDAVKSVDTTLRDVKDIAVVLSAVCVSLGPIPVVGELAEAFEGAVAAPATEFLTTTYNEFNVLYQEAVAPAVKVRVVPADAALSQQIFALETEIAKLQKDGQGWRAYVHGIQTGTVQCTPDQMRRATDNVHICDATVVAKNKQLQAKLQEQATARREYAMHPHLPLPILTAYAKTLSERPVTKAKKPKKGAKRHAQGSPAVDVETQLIGEAAYKLTAKILRDSFFCANPMHIRVQEELGHIADRLSEAKAEIEAIKTRDISTKVYRAQKKNLTNISRSMQASFHSILRPVSEGILSMLTSCMAPAMKKTERAEREALREALKPSVSNAIRDTYERTFFEKSRLVFHDLCRRHQGVFDRGCDTVLELLQNHPIKGGSAKEEGVSVLYSFLQFPTHIMYPVPHMPFQDTVSMLKRWDTFGDPRLIIQYLDTNMESTVSNDLKGYVADYFLKDPSAKDIGLEGEEVNVSVACIAMGVAHMANIVGDVKALYLSLMDEFWDDSDKAKGFASFDTAILRIMELEVSHFHAEEEARLGIKRYDEDVAPFLSSTIF